MFNYRMQRRWARAQHRAYRRQMRSYYRGRRVYGGIGGSIWLIVLAVIFLSHQWLWFPLLVFGIPFFFLVLRPRMSAMRNPMYQPPYNQPTYQQEPPTEYAQPQQQEMYQAYNQGYRPVQQEARSTEPAPKSDQPYQYQERPVQQQYEEPLTMYPPE